MREGVPDRVDPVRRPRRAARAGRRAAWTQLHEAGVTEARLYGDDPSDGVGGDGAFFLLLDEPEVYGLPPDPVVTTRDLPAMWRHAGAAAATLAAALPLVRGGHGRRAARRLARAGDDRDRVAAGRRPGGGAAAGRAADGAARPSSPRTTAGRSSTRRSGRRRTSPATCSSAGSPGGSSLLAAGAELTGRPALARARRPARPARSPVGWPRSSTTSAGPARFVNMLRVFKPTSPMSVGSWLLGGYGAAAGGRPPPAR